VRRLLCQRVAGHDDERMLPGELTDEDLHVGTVTFFEEDEGWGAIASESLPPERGAWVHFSVIDMPGHRSLEAGQSVDFAFEQVQQDSFDYRATCVRLRSLT
jgi:CspA family cold shock protein